MRSLSLFGALLDSNTVNLPEVSADAGAVAAVLSVVWQVAAIISVILVIVGGLKYVLSGGDSNQIASAKNTILYAIVGLVISLSAFMIVTFVIGNL